MTLLELLVKYLPKRGGWPEGAHDLRFTTMKFIADGAGNEYFHLPNIHRLSLTERQKLITREQYEAAIAAQQPIAEFHSRTFPKFKAITVVERDDSWVGTKVDGENYHCYKRHWDIEFISERRQITEPELGIEYVKYNGIDSINQKTNDPVWNGDGLPTVGVTCEAKYNHSNSAEWFIFECVGVSNGIAFGFADGDAVHVQGNEFTFRHIRTEADRKREASIVAMREFFGHASGLYDLSGFYDEIAAGKIPGVELTK